MNGKLIVSQQPDTLPAETGSLAVSLARAEVDLQITTARAYPRSITRSVENILTLATLDEKTAAMCIYALPRGRDDSGQKKIIKGPSIRLAEISASQWGNCRIGARIVHVDRFDKFVEAEGVFHDLETNTAWTARVRRSIGDKKGRVYSDDMIVVTGNAACAIAKRNAIFSGIPRGVWGKGYDAADLIMTGDAKTLVSRRASAIATLAVEYKITADRIFHALDIGGEEDINLERLSVLSAMRSSLKNGEATVEELFPMAAQKPIGGAPQGLTDQLDAIAAGGSGAPPHDQSIGEIISQEMQDRAAEAAKIEIGEAVRNDVDGAPVDSRLDELLSAGRAAATNGAKAFKTWHARLSAADANMFEPYIADVRKVAAQADALRT